MPASVVLNQVPAPTPAPKLFSFIPREFSISFEISKLFYQY